MHVGEGTAEVPSGSGTTGHSSPARPSTVPPPKNKVEGRRVSGDAAGSFCELFITAPFSPPCPFNWCPHPLEKESGLTHRVLMAAVLGG